MSTPKPAESTPLPWKVSDHYERVVQTSSEQFVASTQAMASSDQIKNAAYIAHAANYFPELVAALSVFCTPLLEVEHEGRQLIQVTIAKADFASARATLAKAKGEA